MKQYYYNNPFDIQEALIAAEQKRLITEQQIEDTTKHPLKHIDYIIWIAEVDFKSVHQIEGVTKTFYINADTIQFEYKENEIKLFDEENNKCTLNMNNVSNTVVFWRGGFKNDVLKNALNEIIKMGILVINNPAKVSNTANKLTTSELLTKYNLPQPKYVLVTAKDVNKNVDDKVFNDKLKTIYGNIEDTNKYVCKLAKGHGGSGVFICSAKNIKPILQCIFKLDDTLDILIQSKEDIVDGDIRAHVITFNGKQKLVDSIMRKHTTSDFRTNLSLGNESVPYELTKEQKQLAFKTAEISELVWAGIDIFPLQNNKNLICEINGASGSTVEGDDPEILKKNTEFFTKIINTINELCK